MIEYILIPPDASHVLRYDGRYCVPLPARNDLVGTPLSALAWGVQSRVP